MAKICVFCGANGISNQFYQQAATNLGELIGQRNHDLVYGGSNLGLMGKIARQTQKHGGKVIGVIPELLASYADGEDEIYFVKNMYERKEKMESISDAFITLTGGIGTLDETMTILTHRQLAYHNKPLVIINTNNYYQNLISHLIKIHTESFGTVPLEELVNITDNPTKAIKYIETSLNSLV